VAHDRVPKRRISLFRLRWRPKKSLRSRGFSDGVIAIIITIMVLKLKVPHGAACDALLPLLPVLGS
jgi:uncharacterized membrane protein